MTDDGPAIGSHHAGPPPPRRPGAAGTPSATSRETVPAAPEAATPGWAGTEPAGPGNGGPGSAETDGGSPPTGRFGQPGRPLRRNSFLLGFTAAMGVLLAYTLFLAVRGAASLLVLVFIALFLAIGLNPVVVRLRSWGLPHGLAVATVALGLVLLIASALLALVPPLVTQSGQFIEQVPGYVQELRRNETVNDLVERYDLMVQIQTAANPDNLGRAVGGVFGSARFFFGTVFKVLTILVLTIYFLSAFDRIKALGYALVPASRRDRVVLIGDEILAKVGAYMVGALAIAVLAGGSAFAFAFAVGLAYPFAIAVVVAICDLIPQIGATIAAVVVSLVGFATGGLSIGLACVAFFVVYQQIENYLIYPKVMRRSVKVSDVAAIVAALLGVALFGIIGALVAMPAVAAIQIVLREVLLPRQQSH